MANAHDSSYEEPTDVFNEHSQQVLTVKEGEFVPFLDVNSQWETPLPTASQSEQSSNRFTARPIKPYVEIQRNPKPIKPLSITVETVPTGETKILEVLEEVYNIPVHGEGSIFSKKKTFKLKTASLTSSWKIILKCILWQPIWPIINLCLERKGLSKVNCWYFQAILVKNKLVTGD